MTAIMNGNEHLTAKLGDLAHYGGRAPYDDTESIPYRAWIVWKAMHARSTHSHRHGGEPGFRFDGKLASTVWKLIPELQKLPEDERRAQQQAIRYYLRQSGNAVCLQWGKDKPVIWWVRAEWRAVKVVPESKGYVATHTETRLSKSEAGEDRPPAPVAVRFADGTEPADSTPATPSPKVDGVTPVEIDPRWEQEFYHAVRTALSDRFSQVARYAMNATEPFIPKMIRDVSGMDSTYVYPIINSLWDMGLVSKEDEPRGRTMWWFTTPEQRARLRLLLEQAPNVEIETKPIGKADDTMRRVVLDVLRDGEWWQAAEVAQRCFITRNRTNNILQRLTVERTIERRDLGTRVSQWRIPPQEDAPAATPAPATQPASPASGGDSGSSTTVLAEFLDEIIEAKVSERVEAKMAERTSDVGEKIAILEGERDEAIRARNDATAERDEAIAERDELKQRLDQLRKLLQP